MAEQTIIGGSSLFMTLHATVHGHPCKGARDRLRRLAHGAVTGCALDTADRRVPAVGEIHVIRYPVHLAPRDRITGFNMADQLCLFGRIGLCFGVTVGTNFEIRDRRPDASQRIQMAVGAIATQILDMQPMIECDRLLDRPVLEARKRLPPRSPAKPPLPSLSSHVGVIELTRHTSGGDVFRWALRGIFRFFEIVCLRGAIVNPQ